MATTRLHSIKKNTRSTSACLAFAISALLVPAVPATAADSRTSETREAETTRSRTDHTDLKMFDTSRPRVGTTTPIGPADLASSADCDADPKTTRPFCTEPNGYYRVSGTILHDRVELVARRDLAHPLAPQYAVTEGLEDIEDPDKTEAFPVPAREVLVRITDGCGGQTNTYTDTEGRYSAVFPSWCSDKIATISAHSIGAPGNGGEISLGVFTGPAEPTGGIDDLGVDGYTSENLKADPSLYTVIGESVGWFFPDEGAEVPAGCKDNGCDGGVVRNWYFTESARGHLFMDDKFSREGEAARAFTIMENAMTAMDYYRQLVDPSRLTPINIVLTDEALVGGDDTAWYEMDRSNMIYIPPRMEWSAWAVIHETSHYFDGGILVTGGIQNYGRWGEPMANLRAGMILGTSWMSAAEDMPSENIDFQGKWVDGEGFLIDDLPDSTKESGPDQGWIWRILWDLHDGISEVPEPSDFGYPKFDRFDGGGSSANPKDHLINSVVMNYLPQRDGSGGAMYVDRGMPGPDLVDMLDGMACFHFMGEEEMGMLLHDVMQYDYDFAPHCPN